MTKKKKAKMICREGRYKVYENFREDGSLYYTVVNTFLNRETNILIHCHYDKIGTALFVARRAAKDYMPKDMSPSLANDVKYLITGLGRDTSARKRNNRKHG